jgi:hypothetical protein
MSDKDRMQFSQEIAVFVTTFASEVKELRQMISRAGVKDNNSHQHQDEVLAYLLEVTACCCLP